MSGRWSPSGYPAPDLFAGAYACRFRLCHVRDDGLVVMTVGHQTSRGGRLEPVTNGFNFVSFVASPAPDGTAEMTEHARAACNDARTAEAQHMALLDEWNERDA